MGRFDILSKIFCPVKISHAISVSVLSNAPDLLMRGVKRQRVLGVHTCVDRLYHTFSVSFPSPGFAKGPMEGFASLRFLPK